MRMVLLAKALLQGVKTPKGARCVPRMGLQRVQTVPLCQRCGKLRLANTVATILFGLLRHLTCVSLRLASAVTSTPERPLLRSTQRAGFTKLGHILPLN